MTALGVLVLPEAPGPDGGRIWRRCEDLGFDHAWTLDHLSWRTAADHPWFDALTTLAVAATGTSRMHLGTLVVSPNFRHPVLTARQAVALDHASGGRFVLGIGAGPAGADARGLGGPEPSPSERADRFGEFVTLTDLLLRRPVTTYEGRHYRAREVRMAPGCLRRPRLPLAVAATGPRGLLLAAAHADIWVTIGGTRQPGAEAERDAFATLRRQSARLSEACERTGQAGPPRRLVNLSRVVPDSYSSPERLADLVGRCTQEGFTDVVVAHPRPDGVFAGDPGAFERAVLHVLERTL